VDVAEGPHPQAGQRGLRRPEQPDVHPVDRQAGQDHDQGTDQHQVADQRDVGAAGGAEPAVEGLLDGDRHDHPARRREQREQEGDREALAELGHHPQPAAERGQRALGALVGGQQRLAHAPTSTDSG
jgi:hypothetical protein